MPNQPNANTTDVNTSKQTGTNKQSPNVTGSGETSRSAGEDDIGNPKAKTQDVHRGRETGRADTDMDSDS